MADVYEQNLASKSTLTTTDYIRVVGSDNVSYKQLVSDVAQKVIETYSGSSLAGSSQSVKSAIDALNNNDSKAFYLSTSNTLKVNLSSYSAAILIFQTSANSTYVYLATRYGNGNEYLITLHSTGTSYYSVSLSNHVVTATATYGSTVGIIPMNATWSVV